MGNFANRGREWQPKGTPAAVRVHDFPSDAEGKTIPYGVYDMARNEAWVSVGRDHDTPTFAVASIRHWWRRMGRRAYPQATTLYITADSGGSNGYRSRYTTNTVEIFHRDKRAASHQRRYDRQPSTVAEHMPSARRACRVDPVAAHPLGRDGRIGDGSARHPDH